MEHTVTFTKYKVFIASSMKHSCRKIVVDAVNKANEQLKIINFCFEVLAYSETAVADTKRDTQATLNNEIPNSELFILLAESNKVIGKKTMEEYEYAHTQSLKSSNEQPFIKAFATYVKKGEEITIKYYGEDGKEQNFEQRLFEDSKRYVQCVLQEKFESDLTEWLIKVARYTLGNNLTQKELSYSNHIHKISQGGIREDKNKYYRRDILDGAIEKKLKESPIVILEGNTYSGKTRAAFEFMKNQKEWEHFDFHIYDNRHSAKELNKIHLDYNTRNQRGDIFLFDDINDILKGEEKKDLFSPLWAKLNGYKRGKGFRPEDFGNTRIILTVSGKLTTEEKEKLYCNIFNTTDNSEFRTAIQNIIINFDIYDRKSFRQMADSMMRDGVLNRAIIRPGNYTIGSLFIKTEDIRIMAVEQFEKNPNLVKTLVAHFKYAEKSRFKGSAIEVYELYNYISGKKCDDNHDNFEKHLEELRKNGLIVISKEHQKLLKIEVDKYVLEAFTEVVHNRFGTGRLNKQLIDYAAECQKESRELRTHHICSIAQMGYLLVDRNKLSNDEIKELTNLVAVALNGVPEKEEELQKDLEKTEKRKKNAQNMWLDGVISKEIYDDLIKTQDNILEKIKIKLDKLGQPKTEFDEFVINLIEIAKKTGRYPMIFASSVIANIPEFKESEKILDSFQNYQQEYPERKEIAIQVYKQAVYAMLSIDNRKMTMGEERKIIKRILDKDEKWIAPFNKDDLKDIFIFSRITPFMRTLGALDIIKQLSSTTLDGCEYFDENEQKDIYEKIYLKKLCHSTLTALCRINNYDEFVNVLAAIKNECEKPSHVRRATEKLFVRDFYSISPEIIRKLNYTDRTRFFNYIYEIDDKTGVLGNFQFADVETDELRTLRIVSLNKLLEYLDENAALEGYTKMINAKLCDMQTLSHLLKNTFLNFEQLLRFFGKEDGQTHSITKNQLMGKAETLSDADVCMRLMEVEDCNPSKIPDENAFANYLKIKAVDKKRCIKIIKERSSEYFSEAIITIILNKLDKEQLIDIFSPKEEKDKGYYLREYGFQDEEIRRIRENAIHLGIYFFRLNSGNEADSYLIKAKFDEIRNNSELQALISDPDFNGGDTILNTYMKNVYFFKNYKDVREFYNSLPECCKPKTPTNYIYEVFLWRIIEDYKTDCCTRENAIELFNNELVEAFNIFSECYAREDVIKRMARLYRYRPLLTDDNSFNSNIEEEYVYEGHRQKMSYQKYLSILKNYYTAYVDGTFIYNALSKMQKEIDENIYELLCGIASQNHTGVQYDTIFSIRKDKRCLPRMVQQKLFKTNPVSKIFEIDNRLVYNVSYIKVMWFLLNSGRMTFNNVESFRKEKGVLITETYINLAFKCLEAETLKKWNDSGKKVQSLEKGFNNMVNYMKIIFSEGNPYLHRSIQMCLSMISVAPDEESLENIFKDEELGFADFKSRTEVVAACMKKTLQLRHKQTKAYQTLTEFKQMILKNCCSVNIWIVNIYLSTFIKIVKSELYVEENKTVNSPFESCWPLLEKECKIDMFKLFKFDEKEKEKMGFVEKKWFIEANVQTFSYFAQCTPNLISIMDRMFNGDFTYDDSGKKSCLKDALKNFSFVYDKHKLDTGCLQNEIKNIAQILWRINNRKVFEEICDEYILKSSLNKRTNEWQTINSFWRDLLNFPNLRDVFAHHVCYLAVQMLDKKSNKHISLDESDSKRIEIIRSVLCLENFDNKLKKKMHDCYNKVKSEAENSGGKLLGKNAKLAKMSFLNIFVSMLYPQIQD